VLRRVRSRPPRDRKPHEANVIDRLREQIQERLDQLAGEADRLRKALAALDPRSSKTPTRKSPLRKPAQRTASKPTVSATNNVPAQQTSRSAPRSPRRTAPGATKASVLTALADGEAMTAGQLADKTGLARGTISTTLSKLAKSGEAQKAERGYRIAPRPRHQKPPRQRRPSSRRAGLPGPAPTGPATGGRTARASAHTRTALQAHSLRARAAPTQRPRGSLGAEAQIPRISPRASSIVRSSVALKRPAPAPSRSGSTTVTCSTSTRVSVPAIVIGGRKLAARALVDVGATMTVDSPRNSSAWTTMA
jgi:hypothetical protein